MESLHTASTLPLNEVYSDSNVHTPENSPSVEHQPVHKAEKQHINTQISTSLCVCV